MTIDVNTATNTATNPPTATENNMLMGNNNKALRLANTAMPLKKMAFPAVAWVMATASVVVRPLCISSRKRLTMNKE